MSSLTPSEATSSLLPSIEKPARKKQTHERERRGRESEAFDPIMKDKIILDESSCCNKLLFGWSTPFIKYARRAPLNIEQMGLMRVKERVAHDLLRLRTRYEARKAAGKNHCLMKATMATFKCDLIMMTFGSIVSTLLNFLSPFIVLKLVNFIDEGVSGAPLTWESVQPGVILSAILVGSQLGSYYIYHYIGYKQALVGTRASNAIVGLIYSKHAKISTATNKQFESGQVVNFVQVDSERIYQVFSELSDVISVPIILGLSFAFAFHFFGVTFFAGLAMGLLSVIIFFAVGLYQNAQEAVIMRRKDRRMRVTAESINNMKMLKLNSWQESFLARIFRRRAKELQTLKKINLAAAIAIAGIYVFPNLIPAATFSVFILTGHTLEYNVAVAALVIFTIMQEPLIQIPFFFSKLINVFVSMKRIEGFLDIEEVQSGICAKSDDPTGELALSLRGYFSWGFSARPPKEKDEYGEEYGEEYDAEDEEGGEEEYDAGATLGKFMTLKGINLEVYRGEFLCIIGDTGAGKSSLLHAAIGDMIYVPENAIVNFGGLEAVGDKESFSELKQVILAPDLVFKDKPIKVNGSMSYVEQKSWIQNKTIRENILFGAPYDEDKYIATLKACQLESDLKILPAGDKTEIGEKGINLSGGQKARISLARAVYADRDIVLMDDPISALDANVRKRIFTDVFQGILSSKTRVLVTHAVDFLHLADRICVVKEGQISAIGTFEELENEPHLKKVLKIQQQNIEETKAEIVDIDEQLVQDSVVVADENSETEGSVVGITIRNKLNASSLLRSSQSSFIKIVHNKLAPDEHKKKGYQPLYKQKQGSNKGTGKHSRRPSSGFTTDSDSSDGAGTSRRRRSRKGSVVSDRYMTIANKTSGKEGRILNAEQDEDPNPNFATYKKLFKPGGGVCLVVLVQIAMLFFVFCNIGANFFMQKWAYLPAADQKDHFEQFLALVTAFCFGMGFFILLRVGLLVVAQLKVSSHLHNKLIKMVFQAPINLFFDVTPIGKVLNRFSRDLSIIDENLFFDFGTVLECLYQALATLIVASYAVPWMLIIIGVYLLLCVCVFRLAIPAYKDSYRVYSVTMTPILSFFSETISGGSIVRAFEKEEEFQSRAFKLIDNMCVASLINTGVWSWISMRLSFLSTFMLAAGCAVCIVFRGEVASISLSLMLQYLLTLQGYIIYMLIYYGEIERQMVSVQRLIDLEEIEQEAQGQPKVVEAMKLKEWPSKGHVIFRNVHMRYRPNTDLVLKGLNFDVPPGTKVGVVGRTGAGKSTISTVMSRIVEIELGEVSIDGADISMYDLQELRSNITVIAQDPTLFSGTLKFNLDPFNQYSAAAVEELLIRAGLQDMLNREPEHSDEPECQLHVGSEITSQQLEGTEQRAQAEQGRGIYMKIKEHGANLSAGERQLICICRAILRKNKVVVLDEATANIDIVTEQKIQRLIEEEFTDSTMITIAHRLNTIIKSDMVLVLANGKAEEYDTPKNLMSNPESSFAKLLQEMQQEAEQRQE